MSDDGFRRLRLTTGADRVVVQLSRPEKRNAIDAEMVDELHAVCASLEREPRIVIVIGSDGIFAAGADIAQLRDRDREAALRGINSGLFERVARLPLPTIAAIDGAALGGGAELAYACDFRIGSDRCRLGNPEPGLGIMAAAGGCWRLPELVGEPLAREMLLAGRILGADEAAAAGLLNEVVPREELLERAESFADRIARGSKLALRLTKLALRTPRAAHPDFDDVAQAILFETEEKRERMNAFLDRR